MNTGTEAGSVSVSRTLPVEDIRDWIAAADGPFDATDHRLGERYRRFYRLEFPIDRHEIAWLPVHAEKIFVQFFSRRREAHGLVFLLHGYLDHSGLQGPSIRHLLDLGFDVVAVDHMGHGFSTGTPASTDTFSIYVDSVTAAWETFGDRGRPHFIMGHSLGGAVAMTHMLEHPHVFRKAVLIAPLYRPKGWRLLQAVHPVGRFFIRKQNRLWRENTRDEEFRHFIRHVDPLSPRFIPIEWVNAMMRWIRDFQALEPVDASVLVVQGTDDSTVDWRGNVPMIRKKFADVKVHIVQEGRHHLLNELDEWREKTWEPIIPFLKEHY